MRCIVCTFQRFSFPCALVLFYALLLGVRKHSSPPSQERLAIIAATYRKCYSAGSLVWFVCERSGEGGESVWSEPPVFIAKALEVKGKGVGLTRLKRVSKRVSLKVSGGIRPCCIVRPASEFARLRHVGSRGKSCFDGCFSVCVSLSLLSFSCLLRRGQVGKGASFRRF